MSAKNKTSVRRIGYVYILEDTDRGMVKIGKSRNPGVRLSSLRGSAGVGSGRQYISHRVRDCGELEMKMHATLSECRVFGEWFRIGYELAVMTLQKSLPEELRDNEFLDAVNTSNIEGKKGVEKLYGALTSAPMKKDGRVDPIDSFLYASNHLKMIASYVENQAMLYASLERDFPHLSKIADDFLRALQHIKTSSQIMEGMHDEFATSLDGVNVEESRLLQKILTKQIEDLKQ